MSVFSKATITANNDFNRWYVPPISISIHLCIGSVYAWSMFNPALTTSLGVVTSSANDWSLSDVVWIFSTAIVFLGLAAAFAGKWLEEVGPRLVGFVSACLWGGGFFSRESWNILSSIISCLSRLWSDGRMWPWTWIRLARINFNTMVS